MTNNYNLACIVHRQSMTNPGAVALHYQERPLTYRELAERAAQLAGCIRQHVPPALDAAVRPRVGILASRSSDACVAMLGACWAGATYVPIGLKMPEDRILSILSQCNLSAIIADAEGATLLTKNVLAAGTPLIIAPGAQTLPAPQTGVTLVDLGSTTVTQVDAKIPPALMQAQDTAYIIFTSGTTGVPKGVMISAGSAQQFVANVTDLLGFKPTDRTLETCELTFDISMHNMFTTWLVGAALYILPPNQVMKAVDFVRTHALTVWNSVPSLVGVLTQIRALEANVMPTLRLSQFGGEAMTRGLVDAWRLAAPNSTIFNLYGPTEATVYCMEQEVKDPLPMTPGRDYISIGNPLPGCEAAVMNETGDIVADGEYGELAIAGGQLAQGYLNLAELTEARFPTLRGKRWYRTGDRAMRDASGAFHCVGRIDNQVKVLGHRIELEEIEAHLRRVTGVEVVCVAAWPVIDGVAQGLVAFIGTESVNKKQIKASLKNGLPTYMIPNRIVAQKNMPFNQSGKVDRRACLGILERESS